MIHEEARQEALRRLAAIEAEEGVRILFAIESGSRAWGFPSPDSDYDVRFVYVRPKEAYLSLTSPRDVIETPLDGLWDVNGWDLRKALLLLRKGNAVVVEWLRSPIVYREDGSVTAPLREMAARFGDWNASVRHYHGLLHGHWRREFVGRDQVRLKKYFYAVRSALALSWLELMGSLPPMALPELLGGETAPLEVRQEIGRLLAIKDRTSEVGEGPHIPALDSFIEDRMAWASRSGALRPQRLDPAFAAATDALFLAALS